MSGKLSGKRVVVLGGTSGIGFAVAKQAAEAGAQVVISSSNPERVAAAVQALPKGSEGSALDLQSEPAIEAFFEKTGAFDHLVYTAGESLTIGKLAELTLERARAAFEVRYWGALTAAKYATPLLRKGGSITFTSGTAMHRPMPGWSMGASILGAMDALTRALAVELAPLRVNLVCPGLIRTELWDAMDKAQREGLFQQFEQTLLVKRIGEAEDAAQAYLQFISNPNITGQSLVVDGGGVLV